MVAFAATTDPSRPPLIPADHDNAVATTTTTANSTSATSSSRRTRMSKQVTSRYLASPASSTSSSNSSSSSSTSSRRSLSVERARRPSTPPTGTTTTPTSATTSSMRSLSVSFQGESFFYRAPPPPRSASPGPTTPRRGGPTQEGRRSSFSSISEAENARPNNHHHRWPAAKPKASDPLARSLDCNLDKKDSILAAVHLLRRSMVVFDAATLASDGGDLSASSDTESVSSGSNSGGAGDGPTRTRGAARGISVPARFWQETNSRLRRLPESGLPLSSPSMKSPRGPGRGMASPLRGRNGGDMQQQQRAHAPSIISFAAEVRRAKKGENRIEEAHRLRLLDNRHLQWRCVNARTDAALLLQRFTAEKNLYNAWIGTSELRDSVTIKRIKLQLQRQKLKLSAILKGQMSCLEEWSVIEKDHSSSLSGAIEALKASTLRLPVVGAAKADIQGIKEAVGSAVDVMHTLASSNCSLLSKVEGTSSLVSEIAKVAAQERMLLDQSKDLLSTVAALHVKQCSLQGHMLQLKQRLSRM